jgi:hypothetical protein
MILHPSQISTVAASDNGSLPADFSIKEPIEMIRKEIPGLNSFKAVRIIIIKSIRKFEQQFLLYTLLFPLLALLLTDLCRKGHQ